MMKSVVMMISIRSKYRSVPWTRYKDGNAFFPTVVAGQQYVRRVVSVKQTYSAEIVVYVVSCAAVPVVSCAVSQPSHILRGRHTQGGQTPFRTTDISRVPVTSSITLERGQRRTSVPTFEGALVPEVGNYVIPEARETHPPLPVCGKRRMVWERASG